MIGNPQFWEDSRASDSFVEKTEFRTPNIIMIYYHIHAVTLEIGKITQKDLSPENVLNKMRSTNEYWRVMLWVGDDKRTHLLWVQCLLTLGKMFLMVRYFPWTMKLVKRTRFSYYKRVYVSVICTGTYHSRVERMYRKEWKLWLV